MTKDPWTWDENDLLNLVTASVQESLELEYKRSESLEKTDARRDEISKDVSSFANSAGGVIVYGMKENRHIPTGLDQGCDPYVISKEWLEQVINAKIQRRIDGIRVAQIALRTTAPGRVAYVVSIPQSARAPHQAADKKFYKRFNFASVAMEEYEIRDVANRIGAPSLAIQLAFRPGGNSVQLEAGDDDEYFLPAALVALISNSSTTVAECAVIHLFVDGRIHLDEPSNDVRVNTGEDTFVLDGVEIPMTKLTVIWDRNKGLPLFLGTEAVLPNAPLEISIPKKLSEFVFQYTIGSPGMEARNEYFILRVAGGKASFDKLKVTKKAREP